MNHATQSQRDSLLLAHFGKQRYLFASLMLFLLIGAVGARVEDGSSRAWLVYAALACVYVTGPLAIARTRAQLVVTFMLAALTPLVGISGTLLEGKAWSIAATLVGMSFVGFLVALELKTFFLDAHRTVTSETLWAAVNIYILMAVLFAFFYSVAALAHPGSFNTSVTDFNEQEQLYGLIYFSFVTITTLGYGDITPADIVVGTIAYLEALFGQLYLAIMIARLVGTYVADGSESAQSD